jgi:hypothetical protein
VAPAAQLNTTSGEVRLARGPPRARHHHSRSHVQAFNALTPQDCATTLTCLGITPRRCSTDPLGKTIPATIQHCAERSVLAPWHCAAYFHTANTSSPRRGPVEPSNGGECFFYDYTRLHCDVRPAGTVFSVAVNPVRQSPPLQHHAGYCDDIPNAVGTREDGRRHARRCASYGLPLTAPSSRPTGGGRTTNLCATTLEAALYGHRTRHGAPAGARFAKIAIYSMALYATPLHIGEIVWHSCKLLSPWPIKGGAAP